MQLCTIKVATGDLKANLESLGQEMTVTFFLYRGKSIYIEDQLSAFSKIKFNS